MDLWKDIELDIDYSYNASDSDNVIRNVFLDSVASSTPARHPEVWSDTPSCDLSLMIDLQDISTGDGSGGSPVTMPDLVIDDNFDQMIDQILDEIDLNNRGSVVIDPTQSKCQMDSLPSPLAESTPKKNAASVMKNHLRPSSQTVVSGEDKNYDDQIKSHPSPIMSYQASHRFDHNYGSNLVRFPGGNGQNKYKPCLRKRRQSNLVSVLKPVKVPKLSIGNFFSNFSPDVTTLRKLERLPHSDESEEDYPGQIATVKSIYLEPRNEEFIRHIKKEKERQRRQEMSIYRDVLKDLVPSISRIDKVSTLTVLSEARKYCNHINAQVLQLQDSVQFELHKNIYLLSVLEKLKNQ